MIGKGKKKTTGRVKNESPEEGGRKGEEEGKQEKEAQKN